MCLLKVVIAYKEKQFSNCINYYIYIRNVYLILQRGLIEHDRATKKLHVEDVILDLIKSTKKILQLTLKPPKYSL